MVAKVQRTEQGLAIVLSAEVIESLHLAEGNEIEFQVMPKSQVTYATDEEALRSYRETLPRHEEAYRGLAKYDGGDISPEEALAMYRETLPDHELAYRELAK